MNGDNNRSKTNERVDFTLNTFDNQVYRNGVLMTLERTMFCPCRSVETNLINPDCPYCKGTGWLYTSPIDVFGMVTGLSYQQTIQMNYELINATANLTLSEKFDFRLRYFDKITIKDGNGLIKNTLIQFKELTTTQNKITYQGTVPFQINSIEYLYLILNDTIKELKAGIDFTFDNVTITLSETIKYEIMKAKPINILQASIRYTHYPIYRVLRDEHAIRMNRTINEGKEAIQLLPLQYMIREHSFFTDQGVPID